MSGCRKCGRQTPNRLCRDCERDELYEEPEDEPDVLTDGGEDACTECGVGNRGAFLLEVDDRMLCESCAAPQPCTRCGRPTDDTTLSGEFRCEECGETQTSGSRPAGQEGLDTFVTDGGQNIVQACPECDSWKFNERQNYVPGKFEQYHCNKCGTDFAEPVERPEKTPGSGNLSAAGKALYDADPDMLTDGGRRDRDLPESLETLVERAERKEEIVCRDCGDAVQRRFAEDGRCPGCKYGETLIADGGTQGGIDYDFEDAEKSTGEQLEAGLEAAPGMAHNQLGPGDVAIDLVTRQPLLIIGRSADSLVEFYEAEDFDLATYKQHAFLPVRLDDPVFECVFIGGIEDLHSFSNTYDYPAGRLARVPHELATAGESDE